MADTTNEVPRSNPEVLSSHKALVGAIEVRRALPQRTHRTVSAWCFADHMSPATVTWLIEGEALHRDSLGTEQLIRPEQLNLMSAGFGVAHAEEPTGAYHGPLEGIQLWIAQPEEARHLANAFEHYDELPRLQFGACDATILVGDELGATSPARNDTELVGLARYLPGAPSWDYWMFVAHISLAMELLVLVPFMKFTHVNYRPVALFFQSLASARA